ncbi:hypothetical protein KIN20_037160 [Parelaphostrongylus tenuis]|uniref:Uncharacterized protein n=1 Tax=Parelaphostrongylus tenuis TaxID=148309 RepID=A0AAD5RDK2_PARTN|nr:hypothetical protein KIN20_037160 [Parelaphostrongylus tenuis]
MFEGTAIQSAGPLPQSHQVSTVQYRSKSQPHRPLYGYVEDEPFAYFVQKTSIRRRKDINEENETALDAPQRNWEGATGASRSPASTGATTRWPLGWAWPLHPRTAVTRPPSATRLCGLRDIAWSVTKTIENDRYDFRQRYPGAFGKKYLYRIPINPTSFSKR